VLFLYASSGCLPAHQKPSIVELIAQTQSQPAPTYPILQQLRTHPMRMKMTLLNNNPSPFASLDAMWPPTAISTMANILFTTRIITAATTAAALG
tara:strand:- start:1339 stop:1623 length:285 start_codon:yes stop_codon:yes gene_type:complete